MHLTLNVNAQIIADHTVVEKFLDIPQYYIDEVKKMWMSYAGQSHALGLVWGLGELGKLYPEYKVSVTTSGPAEKYTTNHLRASHSTWGSYYNSTGWFYATGEQEWFTNSTGRSRIKEGIKYCNDNNLGLAAIGFGWCWDHTRTPQFDGGISPYTDPAYGHHWYGSSDWGPSGWQISAWGLTKDDYSITRNLVSMDTYLEATQDYIDYCNSNGYNTVVFFTTAPQDNYEGNFPNESLFQGHRKNEHIRNYVKADVNRILFDYADILCYNDDGTRGSVTWNNNTFPGITTKNAYPINMGHISDAGILRLAKAMWWMLARIAGWDDVKTNIDDSETIPDLFRTVIESKILSIQMLDTAYSGTVSLYSLQGSMLDSKQINGDTCVFNTSQIPPGVYIIVARTNSGSQSKKIVLL